VTLERDKLGCPGHWCRPRRHFFASDERRTSAGQRPAGAVTRGMLL